MRWPWRLSLSLDVTVGPVGEADPTPQVDQSQGAQVETSYHERRAELTLKPLPEPD